MAEVSREHQIKASLAQRWKREYESDPAHAFSGRGITASADARQAQLEREVGKLYVQNEFLKKCLDSLQKRLAESKTKR